MTLLEEARALAPALEKLKAQLHRRPELSFHEVNTTAKIRALLEPLGVEFLELGMETGVAALLRGGRPGPTVALRADIDAITLQEPGGPGTSEVEGVMHACGHDFHTACLYGAARLLFSRREQLSGAVLLIFQPAEEVTQGAAAMLRRGLWEKAGGKPAAIFGLHNRPEVPCGQIAVLPGPIMAGKNNFTLTLHGRSGHGGSPHKCVDVIVPGAAIVSAAQTVVSRCTDPLDSLVCSVCSIHAGTPDNFAPDLLTMTGSLRAHSDKVLADASDRLEALTKDIAAAYGCTADFVLEPQVPVTWNGPEATALARRAAEDLVGAENIVQPRPDMGSEDFAVLSQGIPSFFYWLGSGFPGRENPCWHSVRFRTDDQALPLGAALLARSAELALEHFSAGKI